MTTSSIAPHTPTSTPGNAYIAWFDDIRLQDANRVGGKNASLGEMYTQLSSAGIRVPYGFAITTECYRETLRAAGIDAYIAKQLTDLNVRDVDDVMMRSQHIREAILSAPLPTAVIAEIRDAYTQLSKHAGVDACTVAVRSSATAEDLPNASFAGQQDTYLNISAFDDVLRAVQQCMASVFTSRAIVYRAEHGIDHGKVGISVGVQLMVRADQACSGVLFTLDPESGYRDAVIINATWGLGELLVQGKVDPDEYIVSKHTLMDIQYSPIIGRRLGSKRTKLVYAQESEIHNSGPLAEVSVDESVATQYVLSNDEVLELARYAVRIEQHYGRPMDIEWAKDYRTGELWIVQARPETVHSQTSTERLDTYHLDEVPSQAVLTGIAVGKRVGSGKARVIHDLADMHDFEDGEVLVTEITDPAWEPIMKRAAGIVTNSGGRTSHAAILARELGIPAVVGTREATQVLKTGMLITVSCAQGEKGAVYAGSVPFSRTEVDLQSVPETRTAMMMIVGDPSKVFEHARIPNRGVGLAREELIILNHIGVHPLAIVYPDRVQNADERQHILRKAAGFASPREYFVRTLAEGIGKICAAFYPYDVIVRTSDFKSNEYAQLIGGRDFEPNEENPMIGWRGAVRYYAPEYAEAFALECEALRFVRESMGFTNLKIMIPFCRTPEEGKKVLEIMSAHGLRRGENGLEVYVMCEIPSNVILASQFAEIFDGFSIGSNDLTQLTLGLDRDSSLVAHVYDERNEAVKTLITQAITAVHHAGKKVGICGQAPSDFPEFAEFLVSQGIDSIALNPDAVIDVTMRIAQYEQVNNGKPLT